VEELHKLEYNERIMKGVGKDAESMFEAYLTIDLGLVQQKDWVKTGLSPWEHNIQHIWYYTDVVLVPDYILNRNEKLYLAEVKGTRKVKVSDYQKLKEMEAKTQGMPALQVGIAYVNVKNQTVSWYSISEVTEMWEGIETLQYYHETDYKGDKKGYKELFFK
jgi:hypothetical protein